MNYSTTQEKVATAVCDVICVGGMIRKGDKVPLRVVYSKEWPAGGFRTIIDGTAFMSSHGECLYTNHEAFYDCFTRGT
jgi:hypothetical protein